MCSHSSQGWEAEKESDFELFAKQIDNLVFQEPVNDAQNDEVEPSSQ